MREKLQLKFFKKELKTFLKLIKKKKTRKINFSLLILFFLFLPTQNFYTQLKITSDEPVVRSLDFELPEFSLYPINVTGKPAPNLTAVSYTHLTLPTN